MLANLLCNGARHFPPPSAAASFIICSDTVQCCAPLLSGENWQISKFLA